jgi:hypothetical protein
MDGPGKRVIFLALSVAQLTAGFAGVSMIGMAASLPFIAWMVALALFT